MQNIITPKSVISKNIERKTGKDVWRDNLRLAVFAADKVRSTLGPKGAYKLISYNRGPEQVVKVTKDAIAILDELAILYPPAVVVAEAAKMHRDEAGDGVASFVVFLSALLRNADELLNMKIHPNTIIHGYYLAHQQALKIIDKQAKPLGSVTSDVLDIVDSKRGLLTPQTRTMIMEAYRSASTQGKFDKDNIRFIKKPGCCREESALIKGVVLKKEKSHPNMPDRLKALRIAITSEKPGINRLELKMKGEGPTQIRLNIKSADQLAAYKEAENKLKLEPLKKLALHKVNVLLCEQLLDANLKDRLVADGVFAMEKVDKKDTEAVAKATGARIVGQLSELAEEDLGAADELHIDQIGLEKTVTIQGCGGNTFMLRGTTPQSIDELEAAIRSSLTVLKLLGDDSRVLPGGGATETEMAQELKQYAKSFAGREQVAIEFFADALMECPRCLAENYGLNPVDTMIELGNRHANGFCNCGVAEHGCEDNVCLEPARVKRSIIRRAYEVSALMLRIDELLISKEIAKFHKK
jgi:chaperonin GroEL (HSP60 family)